tara:strand:+ start:123 stop:767 length:645 start_codon:yes stop_codon:yes gene_type:complete
VKELSKRILTSLILLIFLLIIINNKIILFLSLIFIYFQSFYELQNILKKIFKKKILKIYILNILVLLYLLNFLLQIWIPFQNNLEIEKNILFLILTVCIATDIGGFIFGKIFKGKKLSIVSPNKTYSGMIGSFIFSLIFGFVIFNQIFSNEFLILYIILISILSQAGDLLISLSKRKANMKDTGAILPGHGGLLDRIDGLLLALPLSIFLFKIL